MNEFHLGRLLDHVHIRVADLEESKRFYRTVLRAVGRDLTWEGDGAFAAGLGGNGAAGGTLR